MLRPCSAPKTKRVVDISAAATAAAAMMQHLNIYTFGL
jgi:hypothetical protein